MATPGTTRTPDGTDTARHVEFFFDPVCPFCWQTSKWFRQVLRQTDVTAHWRFISLAILNENEDDAVHDSHVVGTKLLRVAAAAREAHGEEVVGPLYEAMGTRLWESAPDVDGPVEGDAFWDAVSDHQQGVVDQLPEILVEVGLPTSLADASDDERFDKELRASTDEAMERTGGDVGTPILSFDPPDGPAFFGPVISTTPSDEEAVELWDAVTTLAQWPSFAEIKRSLRDPIDNELFRRLGAA